MATLSMTCIMRNESTRIRQCFESFIDYVDEIVVVDTGSTDDSIEVGLSCGIGKRAKVQVFEYTQETNPEGFIIDEETGLPLLVGFAQARQMSYDKANSDYIAFVDLDDILSNTAELRTIVDKMKSDGYDIAGAPYYYWAHKPYEYHWVNRIVRNGGIKWDIHSSIHTHTSQVKVSKVIGTRLVGTTNKVLNGLKLLVSSAETIRFLSIGMIKVNEVPELYII